MGKSRRRGWRHGEEKVEAEEEEEYTTTTTPLALCNGRPSALGLGEGTKTHQGFALCHFMTERPKQNEDEGHGIGLAGLNKIQDIIARTAGSSSQSQPDPSQGTVVWTVDSCPRGRTTARTPMSEA